MSHFFQYFCIAFMSFKLYTERDHFFVERGVFYLKYMFLSTPSVGVEYFGE
jgi:hypothetical protein